MAYSWLKKMSWAKHSSLRKLSGQTDATARQKPQSTWKETTTNWLWRVQFQNSRSVKREEQSTYNRSRHTVRQRPSDWRRRCQLRAPCQSFWNVSSTLSLWSNPLYLRKSGPPATNQTNLKQGSENEYAFFTFSNTFKLKENSSEK